MIKFDGQIRSLEGNIKVIYGRPHSSEGYTMMVDLLTENNEKIKGKLVLGGKATKKITRKLGLASYDVGQEYIHRHRDALISKRIEIVIE